MTLNDKVSVVLPTYNRSRYLRYALDSVLKQSLEDIELIVVDDSSTDSTPAIIDSYKQKDQRIRVIRNEVNLRIPQSLNKGFACSTGAYLTWTSDDNMYAPTALEELKRHLDAHEDCDFVYADTLVIDENGKIISVSDKIVDKPRKLFVWNCIGSCFMHRRQLYEAVGPYDESAYLVEDYDYWFRIVRRHKMHKLDQCLYYTRVHADSLGARFKSEIAEKVWDLKLKHAECEAERLWIRAERDCARKDYGSSMRYLAQSLLLKPFNLNSIKLALRLLKASTAYGALQ
jgi:glycosyltransferase involved in cell wall biosynthesis